MAESILHYFGETTPNRPRHRRPPVLENDRRRTGLELVGAGEGFEIVKRSANGVYVLENKILVESPWGSVRDQRIGAAQLKGQEAASAFISQIVYDDVSARFANHATLADNGLFVVTYSVVTQERGQYPKLPVVVTHIGQDGEFAGISCFTDTHYFSILTDSTEGVYAIKRDAVTHEQIDVFGPTDNTLVIAESQIGLTYSSEKGVGGFIHRAGRQILIESQHGPEPSGIAQLFNILHHPRPWEIPAYNMPFDKLGVSVYEQ